MAGRATYFRLYDHGKYIGQYRNFELMELLDIRHHQLIAYPQHSQMPGLHG